MQALRKHYEKIVLGIFLILLLVLSWHLMRGLRDIGGPTVMVHHQDEFKVMEAGDFTALQALSSPNVQWDRRVFRDGNALLYPGEYVWCANNECMEWLPYTAKTCPVCGTDQGVTDVIIVGDPDKDADQDGILDTDEEEYDFLSSENSVDADQDYDRDWFTNLDEIVAFKTDPADGEDYPLLVHRLTLIDVQRDRFDIVLSNVIVSSPTDPEGKWDIVLQVMEANRGWRTRFAKLGEEVNGYKITAVERKFRDVFNPKINETIKEDISEIVLVKEGEEPIRLARQKMATAGLVIRFFLYQDPSDPRVGQAYSVRSNEVLELTGPDGRVERYLVQMRGMGEALLKLESDQQMEPEAVRRRRLPSHLRAQRRRQNLESAPDWTRELSVPGMVPYPGMQPDLAPRP